MVKFKLLQGYYVNSENLSVGIVSKNPHHAMENYKRYLIQKHIEKIKTPN